MSSPNRSVWVWLSYLVVACGLVMFGIGLAMVMGWSGPLPQSEDWSNRNEWLGLGCPLTFTGLIFLMGASGARSHRRTMRRIAQQGIDGTARVLEWKERGGSHNYKPRFTMRLEITVGDEPPYSATKYFAIHAHRVEKFTPGSTWSVRIDPDNPQEFLMEGIDDEFRSS